MVAWRAAGINYVRFSQIAAEVTRKCVKRTTKTVEAKPATLTGAPSNKEDRVGVASPDNKIPLFETR